jgi:hypothetical protein
MSDPGSIIPVSDEQAKAIQDAIKALRGVGGFLKQILGTVPEDLVGYFGGDLLKVRRAENAARIIEKAREKLQARNATPKRPSISIILPLLIAAADEDRDELQEIWARLLAAAADPARAASFRIHFIEAAKKMGPLDAAALQQVQNPDNHGMVTGNIRNQIAGALKASRDEVDISIDNLANLGLLGIPNHQMGRSQLLDENSCERSQIENWC